MWDRSASACTAARRCPHGLAAGIWRRAAASGLLSQDPLVLADGARLSGDGEVPVDLRRRPGINIVGANRAPAVAGQDLRVSGRPVDARGQ